MSPPEDPRPGDPTRSGGPRGAGRHSGAPTPGRSRPGDPAQQFDGGYAPVIRATDHPTRPGRHAGPATPGRPDPADVYIYRDTGDGPDSAASAARKPDEHDASYWYDLPGTGTGSTGTGTASTGSTGTGTAPEPADTRGPFEPLVSSHAPAPVPPALVPEPALAPDSSAAPPGRTGKLEQIREFYLAPAGPSAPSAEDAHGPSVTAEQPRAW